mmetsp:Transcript_26588/g.87275  ORF Transcript_26588/g.87275 Transcript_26588/m.87275 type:complete len:216 (-) Transcript_26588:75-722(-)
MKWQYSCEARPTPPAPACRSTSWPEAGRAASSDMCTVHHVVGKVQACSNESESVMAAIRRASDLDREASAARPCPSAASPTFRCEMPEPTADTMAAQSAPGGPGSPGYTPSTLSTSRKLRPTALTWRRVSPATGSSSSAPICGTMRKLLTAPRASKCIRIGPPSDCAASASRGTRRDTSVLTATSGSSFLPARAARETAPSASQTAGRPAEVTSR